MRNTDEETEYWRKYTRLPSFARFLPLFLLLIISSQINAECWNTSGLGCFNITVPNVVGVALNASSYTWPVILPNTTYGNGTDVRCANYDGSTYTAIPTGVHGQMSNDSNGTILLAFNLTMGVPSNGTMVSCSYGFPTGTNGTTLSALYASVLDRPTTDDCTTTVTFQNTTYGVSATTTGGGNMMCGASSNNLRYAFIGLCLGNYSNTRPSPGQGDPSNNPYIALIQNTTTAYLKSNAGSGDSAHAVIPVPTMGQFFYGEIDADPSVSYGWIIYLNGSISNVVNITGFGTQAAKAQWSVGLDANQRCGLTFSGVRENMHGQRPQLVVSQIVSSADTEKVYVNLTSPTNGTTYFTPASVPLVFNCSGAGSSYNANITINGVQVVTNLTCTSNASTTYIYNTSSNATYTWNVSAGNSSISNISANRYFIVNNSSSSIVASFTPSPAYVTSTVGGYANASNHGTGNFSNISWTLYVNGSVNSTGVALNVPINSSKSLFNYTGFTKGTVLNLTVNASVDDGTFATNTSTTLTISSTTPVLVTDLAFTNATAGHWFYANATANDSDGGSDILNVSISATSGTCVQFSNATQGINFTVRFNCSNTAQTIPSVNISFNDTSALSVHTTTKTNQYPDHAATLSAPSINNSAPNLTSILNCTPGVFSDIDGDTENTSNRSWAWYRNGTLFPGEVSQILTLNATNFSLTDLISCFENTSNSTWPSSNASAFSANVSISNVVNVSSVVITNVAPANASNQTTTQVLTWNWTQGNTSQTGFNFSLCFNSSINSNQTCIYNITGMTYTLSQPTGAIVFWSVRAFDTMNANNTTAFSTVTYYFVLSPAVPLPFQAANIPDLDTIVGQTYNQNQWWILPIFAIGVAFLVSPVLSVACTFSGVLLFLISLMLVSPMHAALGAVFIISGFVLHIANR